MIDSTEDTPERDPELEKLLTWAYSRYDALAERHVLHRLAASLGRNEKCACGSGKKAKVCHQGRAFEKMSQRFCELLHVLLWGGKEPKPTHCQALNRLFSLTQP